MHEPASGGTMPQTSTRRRFLAGASAAGALLQPPIAHGAGVERPALLGGPKTKKEPFPSWPKFDATEEKALVDVLRSGHWYRGNGQYVKKFEEAYAALTGA